MKKELHPANYRFVVFKDMSNGYSFLTRSTAPSKETVKWEDGNEYPLIKLEISSTSHPFFTGQNKVFRLNRKLQLRAISTYFPLTSGHKKKAPNRFIIACALILTNPVLLESAIIF